jgi:uncharacterized protein with PQ loop repeat
MLAWCGAALSCLLTLPQAVRVLRTERLDGISASTYVIVLGNAAVWATWAMCTGEHAAGVPALINCPAAILILRRRDRASQESNPRCCCCGGRGVGPRAASVSRLSTTYRQLPCARASVPTRQSCCAGGVEHL